MRRPEILVVDDRAENLMAMKRLLEDVDAEIYTVSSGNDALGLILDHDFALILLDVQMPDMDGFETAEMIRLFDETAKIPIIFVTAISKEQQHVFKGYESGAVDYIFKPVDGHVLLSKVKIFLSLYRQKQELQQLVAELKESREFIEKQNEELTYMAMNDSLTGLYNRHHFNTVLPQEFKRCQRYGNDMAVLMMDLDFFKKVNDSHGHNFGDFVLKNFAERVKKISRATDFIFRMGGEEFFVILPQIDIDGGIQAGEKIRKNCQEQMFIEGEAALTVTVSIGVASFCENMPKEASQFMQMADKALYKAKEGGRNRVVAYS